MGAGKRHIYCCDSSTWCDFIKWTYIIFGIVFLMSSVLILYRKDDLLVSSPSMSPLLNGNGLKNRIIYDAIKSGVSGALCIAMGVLIWWGTINRSSIFLLCYIIIQLVLCAFSIVSLLGGVIVLDNRTGQYEFTALPVTILAFAFLWIVDIQRKEFSQDILPIYQQEKIQYLQQQQQQLLERVSSDPCCACYSLKDPYKTRIVQNKH